MFVKDNSADKGFLQDIYKIHNPTQVKVLNYLILMSSRYKKVCPSQISMARKFGVSRKTINKNIKILRLRGLISRIRNYNKPCEYFISALLKKYKHVLGYILFSIHKFNIKLIVSRFLEEVTLSRKSVLNHGYLTEVFNGVFKNITHPQARENSSELKKRQEIGRDSHKPCTSQGNRGIKTHQVGTIEINGVQ